MSYYCSICGKTLTTADFSDRCNPPCSITQSELEKTQLELNAKLNLIKECDTLRAENERLREALQYIVDRGYTGASYVAQQALKEVTK